LRYKNIYIFIAGIEYREYGYYLKQNYIQLFEVVKQNIMHLMSAPDGNCFVFPSVSMFPETKSRGTMRFEINQHSTFNNIHTTIVFRVKNYIV
jgi:hypothetical protein